MVAKKRRQPELLLPLRVSSRTFHIPPFGLEAKLFVPENASLLIVFVHGSGSSRLSPRNKMVARTLNAHGMATLLFDLLTPEEAESREKIFDIGLLSERLTAVLRWLSDNDELLGFPVGLFGASTGAAAALSVAARPDSGIFAVVSRGGRPDLAGENLDRIAVPVLLLVGGEDAAVLRLNEDALANLKGPKRLTIVAGASHLFEEPGALEEVAASAVRWFEDYSPVKKSGPV